MLVLGIESSCDDTSVALVECSDKGHFVIAEKTASQIDIHTKYGGVVPEIAGRMHAEKIVPLIEEILIRQPTDQKTPDVIAVTTGPGLITGLLVGAEAARVFSYTKNIPLVSVNHIDGHIHSVELPNNNNAILSEAKDPLNPTSRDSSATPQKDSVRIKFPALALVVSGGHTELILMRDHGDYEILGKTKDDAAGECFDKVAKILGLPYPGGPQISKLAETGNTKAIDFPRPMINEKMNFSAQGGPAFGWSFAGLKTSALYWLRDHKKINKNDFCASIEQAIVDVLVAKTLRAADFSNPKTIILAGGVAANKKLRTTFRETFASTNLLMPSLQYCMDNAAMVTVAGYYHAKKGQYTDWRELHVDPNWEIA